MYSEFFGLRTLPFEDRADTQFYFATPDVEEALAAVLYELHHGSGLGFITGEAGTGKTMLVRALLTRLAKIDQVTVLTWPGQSCADVIREACKGFGVTLPSSHNHARRLNRLRRHLTRVAESNQRSILIVDQAENLSADNMAQVAALVDLEGAQGRLLKIVLVAQPQIQSTLEQAQFARIRQQLFGERRIGELSPETACAYVEHRLRIAGVSERTIFDDGANARIFEISQGVPRLINRVCNASLLAAYGAGVTQISGELVSEAAGQQSLRERSTTFEELGLSPSLCHTAPWDRPNAGPARTVPGEPPIDPLTEDSALDAAISESTELASTAPLASSEELTMQSPTNSHGSSSIAEERLERAISKAERVATTTEASITRFAAIEKHLVLLLDRAESLAVNLAPTVQRGVASTEQAHHKLNEALLRADQRAASFHSQTARVTEWTQRIDDLLARVERTTTGAAGLENRLKETASALADKAEEVQNRITALTSVVGDAERVQMQADQAVAGIRETANAELTVLQAAVEKELVKQKNHVNESIEASVRECEARQRAIAAVVERSTGEVETLRASLRSDMELIRHQSDAQEQSAQRAVNHASLALDRAAADAIERAQIQLDAILKHASAARTEAEERIAGQTEKLVGVVADGKAFEARFIRGTLDNARRDWKELVETAGGQLEVLRTRLDQAVGQARNLDTAIETVSVRSISIGNDVSGYGIALTDKARCLAELERRAEALQPTVLAFQRAESIIVDIKETETRIETLTAKVASALVDAEGGADRAAAACKHIAEVEQALARTRLDRAAAQEATIALRTATDEALQTHQAIVRASGDAESLQAGLLQSRSDARTTSGELRTTLRSANEALLLSSQAIQTAREESRLVREHSERLAVVTNRAGALQGELAATLRAAENRQETLHGLVVHAEEKAHRLGSHHAAASSILDRLTDGTSTGHQLVDRLTRARDEAEGRAAEIETKVERMLQEVCSLTTRTESLAKELSESHDAAQVERKALLDAVTAGTETSQLLSTASVNAETAVTALAEQQSRAERSLDRLSGLAEALQTASQMQTTLIETVAKAEQLAQRLSELNHEVGPHCATIYKVQDETRALATTLQTAREEAQATARQLTAIVSAHAERLAHADAISDEAVARVERMRDEVNMVGSRLEAFSHDLTVAADQPKSILDAFQVQTHQLEQVCAAVRKVFASLSQATLEARRQTDELQATGTGLGQRWSQLASETTRAGRTLHEWVEEAVRVQTRLERTLHDCPSFQTTPPTSAVSDVAEILERITRNADVSEHAAEEPPRLEVDLPTLDLAAQRNRADQIAQLIAAAKMVESATS